jgi:hypothetical protein
MVGIDTEQKKSANFERLGSATRGLLFPSFPSGRISKTVSFSVYFQFARSILTPREPAWALFAAVLFTCPLSHIMRFIVQYRPVLRAARVRAEVGLVVVSRL